jgi:SAM-dependent methyltransferase
MLYRINRSFQSAFGLVGLELQLMPKPKRMAVNAAVGRSDSLMESSVNWLRVPMYRSIYSTLSTEFGHDFFKGKLAIEIGASEGTIVRFLKELGASVQLSPDYPEIDVESLPYPPDSYDAVILDQTLEHLKHPWRAVEQIRRTLKRDGLCICTSVFVYPIHHGGNYGDYYRFSPDGFRALFEDYKVISADGWGNAEVLKMTYNHSERGPEGSKPPSLSDPKQSGIYDYSDSMNFMMTWCIAQKA